MLLLDPPLLNSANVWASSEEDLETLYQSQHTGAITTRTSLLNGFQHDDRKHQYCYFEPESMSNDQPGKRCVADGSCLSSSSKLTSSLNTLGYSPISLYEYIAMIEKIEKKTLNHERRIAKSVIFSVTGSATEVVECGRLLEIGAQGCSSPFMMEVNLSCPNILDKPPPAYSKDGILSYLMALRSANLRIPVGIKTPPYTYQGQFANLIDALVEAMSSDHKSPVSFITAVNTLGSCFVPGTSSDTPAIASANGSGIGGLAGLYLSVLLQFCLAMKVGYRVFEC